MLIFANMKLGFAEKKNIFLAIGMLLALSIGVSCNVKKNTRFNRGYQDLTTQFNILFHGNEYLKETIEDFELGYVDDYTKVLPVFKDPTASNIDPFLQRVNASINRANTIIDQKPLSRFHDEAYLLLGKSFFYRASFFSSVEYLNYLQKNYPNSGWVNTESLIWESRALLNMGRLKDAQDTLAYLLKHHSQKARSRSISEMYATLAQLYIKNGNYVDAIDCIKTAIERNWFDDKRKLRWTYIKGQLHDLRGDTARAFDAFKRVARSNAEFELAFNADLEKLKFQEYYRPANEKIKFRIKRLKGMLREDNNVEFLDQVYYKLGVVMMGQVKLDDAIDYFKKSIKASVKNPRQKGISYLTIAEIYFDEYSNYAKAGLYYDSALVSLPKDFHKYDLIKNKYNNLKPLTQLMDSIATFELYLNLATMPELERERSINAIILARAKQMTKGKETDVSASKAIKDAMGYNNQSIFYFYSSVALSEGKKEFEKKWGNRELVDNWRHESNGNKDKLLEGIDSLKREEALSSEMQLDTVAMKREYVRCLPIRKGQQDTLGVKIMESYFQIANFKRDILNDKEAAIKAYQLYVYKYPKDKYAAESYYNLYRLYANKDQARSDYYRSMILNEYQDSRFARIILDPNFLKNENKSINQTKKDYEIALDLYQTKKYQEAFDLLDKNIKTYGTQISLSAKFYYLHSLAMGHIYNIDSLVITWHRIIHDFPNDTLVVKTIKNNLNGLIKLADTYGTRTTVLQDEDLNLSYDPLLNLDSVKMLRTERNLKHLSQPKIASKINYAMYNFGDSLSYNFVLVFKSKEENLTNIRTKIGQFNRSKYSKLNLEHDLIEIENYSVIYVNNLETLQTGVTYYDECLKSLQGSLKIDNKNICSFLSSDNDFEKMEKETDVDKFLEYFYKYF